MKSTALHKFSFRAHQVSDGVRRPCPVSRRRKLAAGGVFSLGVCLLGFHGAACATVFGTIQEADGLHFQPSQTYSESTQLQVSQSTTPYSGATLFSDSDTGVMRLSAKGLAHNAGPSNSGADVIYPFTTRATVSMVDNVTFQGFAPGSTGSLYYAVDGSFQQSGVQGSGGAVGYGEYGAKVYDGVQNHMHTVGYLTRAGVSDVCSFTTDCLVGETPAAAYGVISFPLTGAKYTFNLFLQMSASGGYVADFSSTAKAYLSLPAGVTYTSSSGGFLTLASPISPVPEPDRNVLLMAGLVLVGAVARARPAQEL